MSLTDKFIKNTYYHLLSQALNFLSPLILTPVIIAKIGSVDFGIYVLILGFIGTFGLLDISLSSSFVKFIAEHYNKNEKDNLISVINTGFLFYFIFSGLIVIIAFTFSDTLISLVNIPPEKIPLAETALIVALAVFFLSSTFSIFNSILIGLQKMYLGAIASLFVTAANFIAILVLMLTGYGLISLMIVQLVSVIISIIITIALAKKVLPYLKLNPALFSRRNLRSMGGFGLQMQVSRLSTFASEKYDEFLLGAFTNLGNVTFFNLGNKSASYGKYIPSQLIAPIAPLAAELGAKNETAKLQQLYIESTKYLNSLAIPIFTFLFVFADYVFLAWMGKGYEASALILRILSIGYLTNFILSVPGNTIIPNTGKPKYQMFEGLIFLGVNLVLSYFLIKNYGITGAAVGNAVSAVIASSFIFATSNNFFKTNPLKVILETILKPVVISLLSAVICFMFYIGSKNVLGFDSRVNMIISVVTAGIIFTVMYFVLLLNSRYFNKRDFKFFMKFLAKVPPVNIIVDKERKKLAAIDISKNTYKGELVSICIITYNRLAMIQKNIASLLPTLKNVNYELIIWDNNSTDGTGSYLKSIEGDINGKIVICEKNIGTTARGKLFEMANGEYIIGMDDDVWDFSNGWIEQFVAAYKTIPNAGFIATDVVQDSTTTGAKLADEHYVEEKFSGSKLIFQSGPAGGWCFMVSRKVYTDTGKFYFPKDRIFFGDDGDYSLRVLNKGYRIGIIKGLKVYHATGMEHNIEYKDTFNKKMEDLDNKTPLTHKLGNIIKKLITFRRYKNRLLEQIDRLILADEN
jgi:O-antigen/teichoic acid export membrane protein/GT2 family glycosyltransferase